MHTNKLANPGPLGLMGFGMTTVLLNLHNAGFFPLNSAIISMGIFFGGTAQIPAGLLEYKKGNTFGMTAFTAYGSFWLSPVGLLLLPRLGPAEATEAHVLGIYRAVGRLHPVHVLRHPSRQPRAAVRVRQPHAAVRPCWPSATSPAITHC